MLAFNTASETFRLVSRPPGVTLAALLELDGLLCGVTMPGTTRLDMWVFQDHKAERWTLRLRMEVRPPRCIASGREVLVQHGDVCWGRQHPHWGPPVSLGLVMRYQREERGWECCLAARTTRAPWVGESDPDLEVRSRGSGLGLGVPRSDGVLPAGLLLSRWAADVDVCPMVG
ncbi:hypothetical protein BAE44_0026241 [Dichanthelium oligosanthes]|uniref:F-box associated domain-containing protein n=1 Tax=Dichanthelium oligosanthes TaxID=888268 RepID=A0A1E5UIP1_9POAL|nr:hypothetical protein BAE44_0026241 [Dichanthelium oligosanthes]